MLFSGGRGGTDGRGIETIEEQNEQSSKIRFLLILEFHVYHSIRLITYAVKNCRK